ncbi:triple tyrosine motif-containing protein [Pedobacter sp. FW305-3-2-15-E-R2A2]|uniref:triple tyrosine motif-containing protein n=1 Tax=Pedobacter sp. FW305-3-2-15-E-R2A2 TaxID=3140251 RepID=UPI0031402149
METMPGTYCNDISSIEEDLQGNVWVSTLYGLSKYDRTVNKFTNYYSADGIGGNQFNPFSSCRLPDGTIIFGATHGLTFFNPVNVAVKRSFPLYFENLRIHSKIIKPYQGKTIIQHLTYNLDIQLNYDQNNFTISFSALDYSDFERVQYSYMMEGYDKYWIDANKNREAYYSYLPAGSYKFKVKMTNNDKSIIDAENSIEVRVSPAPWLSWWAFTIYFLLSSCVILLFIQATKRIKTTKKLALMAKYEKEKEQSINKMNMTFFANVSHEFRTPLTMVSGPIATLYNDHAITVENKQLLQIVNRSVNRMLKLINQLMDFNKLENYSLKLNVKKTDLMSELNQIVDIFKINAANKHIILNTHGFEDSFFMFLDADKLDK